MDGIKDDVGEHHYKSLTLDTEHYQSLLDDEDIPEDKKQELIATLWQIVVSFVDLGFGIHPLQQPNADIENALHPDIAKAIADVANEQELPEDTVRSGLAEKTNSKQLKEAWPERSKV